MKSGVPGHPRGLIVPPRGVAQRAPGRRLPARFLTGGSRPRGDDHDAYTFESRGDRAAAHGLDGRPGAVRRLRPGNRFAPRVDRPRGHAQGDHQVNEGRPQAVGPPAPSRQHPVQGGPWERRRLDPGIAPQAWVLLQEGRQRLRQGVRADHRCPGRAPYRQERRVLRRHAGAREGRQAQLVGREHRQGRHLLRAEPRQEHAGDAQGQGLPTSIDRCRRRRGGWA